MGGGVVGAEGDDAAVVVEGGGEVGEVHRGGGEPFVGDGVVRAERGGGAVGDGGGGGVAELAEGVAEVVVGFDVVGLEVDRAAVGVAGGVEVVGAFEGDAAVVVDFGGVGEHRGGTGEERGGVVGAAELEVEGAEEAEGVVVVGVGGEGAAVGEFGVGEAAGLVEAGGGVEVGLIGHVSAASIGSAWYSDRETAHTKTPHVLTSRFHGRPGSMISWLFRILATFMPHARRTTSQGVMRAHGGGNNTPSIARLESLTMLLRKRRVGSVESALAERTILFPLGSMKTATRSSAS